MLQAVTDLGAIDVERGARQGWVATTSSAGAGPFRPGHRPQLTGESTDRFPAEASRQPEQHDFLRIFALDGAEVDLDSDLAEAIPVRGERRSTVAARLRAIYGNVGNLDAFTGMVVEAHVAGADFGETMRAAWARQFRDLRDGDRFFYLNQRAALDTIRNQFGIDYRRNLGGIIALNTDIPRSELSPNVFFSHGDVPPSACSVRYRVTTSWPGNYQPRSRSPTPQRAAQQLDAAVLHANGQNIYELWQGVIDLQEDGTWPWRAKPSNAR